MATQAISNLSIFQELQNFYQDRRTDLRQLGSALQAGDLSQAQQIYSALAALGQSGPFSNSEPFSKSDRAQAFEAVGQALQSGDLASAQAAFAKQQQTLKNITNTGQHSPAFIVNLSATQNAGGADDTAAESIYQQRQEFRQERKADLAQLGKALQSGNADAAQQAYDALVALGQKGPFRNAEPFQRADRAQDFTVIGQALQSGNLAGAQQAFLALAQTFDNHRTPGPVPLPPLFISSPTTTAGGIRPPHHTTPPTTQPPTTLTPPTVVPRHQPPTIAGGRPIGPPEIIINVGGSTTPNGNSPEIVVNLPKPSSTPEEIQINFGNSPGAGGQLTLDVSQQSGNAGEEIAINFNPGHTNYQLVLNLFETANSPAQSNSLSLTA